jgi:hypothetical protein
LRELHVRKIPIESGGTEKLADEVYAFVIRELSFCGVMVPLAFRGRVMCDERADDSWCGGAGNGKCVERHDGCNALMLMMAERPVFVGRSKGSIGRRAGDFIWRAFEGFLEPHSAEKSMGIT